MGSSQRLAAVAAVSHSRHYNYTHPEVAQVENTQFNINMFLISAMLFGVLIAVCTACWRRLPSTDKPDDVVECRRVYTVSEDNRLSRILPHEETPLAPTGPPPAYDAVVDDPDMLKHCHPLQEVVTEPCPRCNANPRPDSGLPSYEAAVLLRDTKL